MAVTASLMPGSIFIKALTIYHETFLRYENDMPLWDILTDDEWPWYPEGEYKSIPKVPLFLNFKA